MKTRLVLILSVMVFTAIGFLLFREPAGPPALPEATPTAERSESQGTDAEMKPTPVPPPPVDPRAAGRPALLPPNRADLRSIPPHPDAVAIGTDAFTPEQELDVLANLLLLYREAIGSVPTGEKNAHIMNALRGNNPERQSWFPLEHPRLSPEGDLLDPWGTPYFFHNLSSTRLEVRSAGPDREMFSDDDLIRK